MAGPAVRAGRVAAFLAAAVLASTLPAQGQIFELMRIVSQGGSWLGLPVTGGRASLEGPVVPVAGLTLDGCLRVWDGHSGEWTIRAEDSLGESRLDVTAKPGQPVRFAFRGGVQAQLDVQVEWSEARDTTLHVWVGVAPPSAPDGRLDTCQPPPTNTSSRPPPGYARAGTATAAAWKPVPGAPEWPERGTRVCEERMSGTYSALARERRQELRAGLRGGDLEFGPDAQMVFEAQILAAWKAAQGWSGADQLEDHHALDIHFVFDHAEDPVPGHVEDAQAGWGVDLAQPVSLR